MTALLGTFTVRPGSKYKKKEVVRCVLVRKRAVLKERNGCYSRFDNAVVLVDIKGNPIATRIFGAVSHKLRRLRLMKVLSCCSSVI